MHHGARSNVCISLAASRVHQPGPEAIAGARGAPAATTRPPPAPPADRRLPRLSSAPPRRLRILHKQVDKRGRRPVTPQSSPPLRQTTEKRNSGKGVLKIRPFIYLFEGSSGSFPS